MEYEWLGELAFTHYYATLSHLTGVDFGVRWTTLNDCERLAWIESGKQVFDVATQYKRADEELSLVPFSSLFSSLAEIVYPYP